MYPVKSLQHMLDQLARENHTLPRLLETGIFDEPTLEAVMLFQRDFSLPVTGVVDQKTWEDIVRAYYANLLNFGEPSALRIFPHRHSQFSQGDTAAAMLMIQAMLNALSERLSDFLPEPVSGSFSGATASNLRRIQLLSNLPDSGILNRATWSILVRLYEAVVKREALSKIPRAALL